MTIKGTKYATMIVPKGKSKPITRLVNQFIKKHDKQIGISAKSLKTTV